MTKKKETCGTCPYQEAKQAIAKAEDDFSKMLDKGMMQCTKAAIALRKKKDKLSAMRKKNVDKKKVLTAKIKTKSTAASIKQLDKVKEALSTSVSQLFDLNEEFNGVKHGLTKIKSLQKQRSVEANLLIKFRKQQEKKTVKKKKVVKASK